MSAAPGLTKDERRDLARQLRVAFDTPPEQRVIQDTWLYAAAMAEQWYVDRAARVRGEGEFKPVIRRIDRHSITVDGLMVTASVEAERELRAMNAEQVARFVRIMGGGDPT